MRYTSPEEARSDLFLSVAVFLFGGLVIALILRIIPLQRIPGVSEVLGIVVPIVTTVLVPFLLIRHRKESIQDYLQQGGKTGFMFGLVLAAPIVLSTALQSLLEGNTLAQALPILQLTAPNGVLFVAQRLVLWVGSVALAWYATVKAEDAFRPDPKTIRQGTVEIGRVLAIIAGVTTLLLSLRRPTVASFLALALGPLGVAASCGLALRRLRGPSSTSRAALLTPTALLAIGVFRLTFEPVALVGSLYGVALYGGIGLLIGIIHQSRQPFFVALALALALALASVITLIHIPL
jgi:hypothetical protein